MTSAIDLALRRSRRHYGPAPKGTKDQALVLWKSLTTAEWDSWASFLERTAPEKALLADGAVSLARVQAERGIRTIAGRQIPGGGAR